MTVLTVGSAEGTAESGDAAFDALDHGQILIRRELPPLQDINFLDPRCLTRFGQHYRTISRVVGRNDSCLHALRAFPEGVVAAMFRAMNPGRTRLITYAHGEELLIARTSRQLKAAAKFAYRNSDLVIANSDSTRRLVSEIHPQARIECIHPGVDVAKYLTSSLDISSQRKAWGVRGADEVVIATVARMEPRKNQDAVLRAMRLLCDEGLPLRYVCAGDGEQRRYLRDLAGELDLAEQVHFPGRVSDAEKRLIFASADIHAMPSVEHGPLTEGFGIVFLEAAAAGRPSICGNVGGQREAVLDGETGIAVDGSDFRNVADAIRVLAENPTLREQMGEKARCWAHQNDWSRVVSKTLNVARSAAAFA